MAVVLLTGSTGFVGRHLLAHFKQQGHQVRVLLRHSRDQPAQHSEHEFIMQSVDDTHTFNLACHGVDIVVHAGGLAHVTNPELAGQYEPFQQVNVQWTRQLAQCAFKADVQRFVFVSSIGAVGNGSMPGQTLSEFTLCEPTGHYAQSKLHAEQALAEIAAQLKGSYAIIRPPLVHGPNAPGNLAKLAATPKESHVKSIYKAPATVLNKRVQPARRFVAQSWSLRRLKNVAKHYDCTLNDVVLAMCGGALREYLLGYATLPEYSLVANVPVSVRSADAADEGGNAISAVQVTLGTRIKSAPARLRAIQESMNAAKQRLGAMSKVEIDTHTIMTNLPLLAGQVSRLDGRVPVLFNVVVSNVPGPSEARYLNGAELLANYPASLIWHGYAMNITVQSYRDNLDFGVIACRESAPKVQRMLDFLEAALVDLEQDMKDKKLNEKAA